MITKVDVSYPDGGVPGVKLKGEDKSIEMGLTETKKKLWSKTTVGAIVRQIGQGHYRVQPGVGPAEPRSQGRGGAPGRQD